VIPVVWKNRLMIFWLKVIREIPKDIKSPLADAGDTPFVGMTAKQVAPRPVPMNIQAMFCWSEHFNGTWQPTKTSGIDVQALLGSSPVTDFFRSKLQMSVAESSDKNLRIEVSYGNNMPMDFVLFNTHSAPLVEEVFDFSDPLTGTVGPATGMAFARIRFPKLSSQRKLITQGTSDNTFRVHYSSVGSTWDFSLIHQISPGTAIQPQHPLPSIWEAPFIYADNAHAFFVRSSYKMTRLDTVDIFDGVFEANVPLAQLAPIVAPPVPVRPRPNFDFGNPGGGVLDSASVQRFLSEDANIRHGLGSSGSIKFGEQDIGPAGAIGSLKAKQ
jgi:Neuraminidase-like domain